MKQIFAIALLIAFCSCTNMVYINEKSIACISQIEFSNEAINALTSLSSCNTFYQRLKTETDILKKVSFVNLSLCLVELKSVPDAASLIAKSILARIHECTSIKLQSSLLSPTISITNKIVNQCIEPISIPQGFKFDTEESTPCGDFNISRLQGPQNEPVSQINWKNCRDSLGQSSSNDPNNSFVSAIQSCVEIGRIVTAQEVNECFNNFSHIEIPLGQFAQQLCNNFNDNRLNLNNSTPINYYKFLPCYYYFPSNTEDEIYMKSRGATCAITGKMINNSQVNNCIDSITIPEGAQYFFRTNSKCVIFNQERSNPNNAFNIMNWFGCRENLPIVAEADSYINEIQSCILSV